MIDIINGKVFIDKKETTNIELIGYSMLDLAEKQTHTIISNKEIGRKASEIATKLDNKKRKK